jgi:hypothetical protein
MLRNPLVSSEVISLLLLRRWGTKARKTFNFRWFAKPDVQVLVVVLLRGYATNLRVIEEDGLDVEPTGTNEIN